MGDLIDGAVAKLRERMPEGFGGLAKFVIEGEGAIMLDATGVRAGDEEADVTLRASAETFRALLSGDLDPTRAFMSGALAIDGSMGQAMKLAAALA